MKNTTTTNPLPKLCFNRVETAKIINVSPATLDRLVCRERIFPLRDTSRPMFPIWEIERFLRGEKEVRSEPYWRSLVETGSESLLNGHTKSGQN